MFRFIILSAFLVSFASFSQESRTAQDILTKRQITIPYYHLHTGLMEGLVLEMPFGKSSISESERSKIKNAIVTRVDLVYTDYPLGSDLSELNLKRIKAIQNLRKDLVTNKEIPWKFIKQTGCKNEAEAKVLFHGVVIHYRPEQSKEVTEKDLVTYSTLLPHEDSTHLIKKAIKKLPDTTVIAVLNRNKDKWDKMHVVADLTGSMSPYSSQLILWFHLNIARGNLNHVTFFNDGDRKTTTEKEIGSTGGIYHGKATTYGKLKRLAIKTMKSGGGGDGPENDCEALIKAIEDNPEAIEYILIADNMAPVKDYVLLSKIDKPIRVVLCGARGYGINVQYLNLAAKTGGSIHTIEKDIENLSTFKEGQVLVIGRKAFKVVEGEFVKMKR